MKGKKVGRKEGGKVSIAFSHVKYNTTSKNSSARIKIDIIITIRVRIRISHLAEY